MTKRSRPEIRELKNKAASGDAEAQKDLATAYYYGIGVDQSYHSALAWFRKAAKQRVPIAISYLADMYNDGNGVKKNLAYAFKLYQQSLAAGFESGVSDFSTLLYEAKEIKPADKNAEKGFCAVTFADDTEAILHIGAVRIIRKKAASTRVQTQLTLH